MTQAIHPEKTWTSKRHELFGPGEWSDEPDKIQWIDEATGLDCLIVRNQFGALCGYVGVPESNPHFGVPTDADVHGGLTFGGPCSPHGGDEDAESICHVPFEGRTDKIWWHGFDCAHGYDLIPLMKDMLGFGSEDIYRNVTYVKRQCKKLAAQLAV